ncbi:hypothetical protein EXS62_02595 [Candidatus Kaiserbacteria bacterium]|nr:hypothetical protein [Candidatus Kaiserbacteria bacterium]
MGFFIFFGISIVAGLVISNTILYGLNSFYKVKGNSFKYTAYVYLFFLLGVFVVGIVATAIPALSSVGSLLVLGVGTYVAYIGYQKFFKVSGVQFAKIWVSFLVLVFSFSFAVLPIRLYVMEPFVLKGTSMKPDYMEGDYIIINKFDRNIQPGDAVVAWFLCTDVPCPALRRATSVEGNTYHLSSDDGSTIFTGDVEKEQIIGKVWFNLGLFPFSGR